MRISIESINFNNINKNLKHLSNEQIVEVIEKYYRNEKIQDILDEYKISTTPSTLIKTFPTKFVDEKCEKCGCQLVVKFKSKSSMYEKEKVNCLQCGHDKNKRFCNCRLCKAEHKVMFLEKEEQLKKALQEKIEKVQNALESNEVLKILEDNLTLEDRLYMSALLRCSLSEDMSIINPLGKIDRILAPTEKFVQEIIKTLVARKIIKVSRESSLDAFDIRVDETGAEGVTYRIYDAKYEINVISEDGDYGALIKRLMYPNPEIFDEEFCYEMWKKVALKESEEYLLYEMRKVGYNFTPGEKTYRVLENLLDQFSIGQIYNIIYRAVANSTRRYQAKEITKIHAQNSVIASCELQGERAVAENWTLKAYSRRIDVPQSIISEVLFNSIMQISTLGFSEVPTKDFR
ncbi:hypothetical protein [Kurthia gibsonii]|uniref:hypothetical protein n=1 Tax=Kurthia gibsonii TaxID=33946 RepID=UPI00116D54E8|nr:hypothetical protein [Kurthia gibsonii]GED19907.1 hypothetical protein KGI01_16480 [Kurthia gibsonii]